MLDLFLCDVKTRVSQREWQRVEKKHNLFVDSSHSYVLKLLYSQKMEFLSQTFKILKKLPIYSKMCVEKQLIFGKNHLSKFRPNWANSCHNMGIICKKKADML